MLPVLGGAMNFHQAAQNGWQLELYELLISGIFHLMLSDWGRLRITETVGRGPV